MNLHYRVEGQGKAIVLIHGLFGSLDNLGLLARSLKDNYKVISVDLRNHGKSAHTDTFTYRDMANDVLAVIDELNIEQFSVVGHSMGGKVAMALSEVATTRLDHLMILDMAPVHYHVHRHENVFAGLREVAKHTVHKRSETAAPPTPRRISADSDRGKTLVTRPYFLRTDNKWPRRGARNCSSGSTNASVKLLCGCGSGSPFASARPNSKASACFGTYKVPKIQSQTARTSP